MGETLRDLSRRARKLMRGGGRQGVVGRVLIVAGLALLAVAVIGAIVTSL